MDCKGCLFFEIVKGNEWPDKLPYHCKRSKALYTQEELDSGEMGRHCRLWDAYIPKDATQEQIDKAVRWQNMSYYEQPDYHDYFK